MRLWAINLKNSDYKFFWGFRQFLSVELYFFSVAWEYKFGLLPLIHAWGILLLHKYFLFCSQLNKWHKASEVLDNHLRLMIPVPDSLSQFDYSSLLDLKISILNSKLPIIIGSLSLLSFSRQVKTSILFVIIYTWYLEAWGCTIDTFWNYLTNNFIEYLDNEIFWFLNL